MNQEGKALIREKTADLKKADHKVQKRNGRGRKMAFLDGVKGKISKSRIFNYAKSKGFVGDYETEYGGF